MKKIDYSGKKVHIGFDVHKTKYVAVARCDNAIVKRWTSPATPEAQVASLKKWFEGAHITTAYEAGFSGFGLHRTLVEHGIESIVVNPASIEVKANDRVKTDGRDAAKTAEQLEDGRLKGIYIPSQDEELKRALTRTREQVLRARTRFANQIKSKLHYFGWINADDRRTVSSKYLKEVEKWNLPEELRFALGLLISTWRHLTAQLIIIRKKLAEQSTFEPAVAAVYRSVPGVGPVSERTLANELGDLSRRFRNERAIFSYTGLTPSEHSSGDKRRQGHISRQGSARLRCLLVEIAWRSITKDPALKQAFDRIAVRAGKKKAIVAIARKLIGRIRACFCHGTLYQMGHGPMS